LPLTTLVSGNEVTPIYSTNPGNHTGLVKESIYSNLCNNICFRNKTDPCCSSTHYG